MNIALIFTKYLVIFIYDFLNNKVVILDELVMREKQNSKTIAVRIKEKMEKLFGEKRPYLLWSDNNNQILINDLQMYHDLNFIPTRKDNKEAQINQVRLKIMNREIVIHPRCTTLIYHMKHANWNKTANARTGYKDFARSADAGHFDAVDALIYLIRNVIYGKNPYPDHYDALTTENRHVRNPPNEKYSGFKDLFKVRKSIKN